MSASFGADELCVCSFNLVVLFARNVVFNRELPPTQFSAKSARDLCGHVSRRIPATTIIMNNNDGDGCEGEEEEMFYEKIIIIKVGSFWSVIYRVVHMVCFVAIKFRLDCSFINCHIRA